MGRQPESVQLGTRGESAVKLEFENLGWGVVMVPREHDLGRDLFALVRDNRRFDLNLMLVVQVKTGPSYFQTEHRDEAGEVDGWWFVDSARAHVDDWLEHVVPHLVVLHDDRTGSSYWAHVTRGSVESTGKGAKILVPRSNLLDREHRAELTNVAATVRPAAEWEGSVWSDLTRIPPRDLLRHAVLVPRLVAPHRNAGLAESVSVEQVLALLVEARLRDVDRLAKIVPGFLTREEASASGDWMWRFIGAFNERLTTGSVEQLLAVADTGSTPEERATATAVAAASLIELSRADEAIELIGAVLAADDCGPVDYAWLCVQRARACLEVGRLKDASADAARALVAGRHHAHDLTATAIAGAGAAVMFSSEEWDVGELGQVLASLDNMAAWWRSQRESAGATAVIEREFTTWIQDRVIRFSVEDEANNRLYTAALLASLVGDHDKWRALTSLNAKQALLLIDRTSPPDDVQALLNDLRTSGDAKALGLAVERIVTDGPAIAVSRCMAEIDFSNWTRTTGRTNLALLRQGGDVLDTETASAAISWLLATLSDPADFVTRAQASSSVTSELVDVLAGVAGAASVSEGRAIVDFFLQQPYVVDDIEARPWARLLAAVPEGSWDAPLIEMLFTATAHHHERIRSIALGIAADHQHPAATEELLQGIRQGSDRALAAFAPYGRLPADVAALAIDQVDAQVKKIAADAKQGRRIMHFYNYARILATLNIKFPTLARWDSIFTLLEEPGVSPADKNGACSRLVRHADTLPDVVRARLAVIAQEMIDHPILEVDRIERRPDRLGMAAALAVRGGVDERTSASLLSRALSSAPENRAWVPLLTLGLPSAMATGVLVVLVHDAQVVVREGAASCVAKLFSDARDNEILYEALLCSIRDPGTRVRNIVAAVLCDIEHPSERVAEMLEELAKDISASVRRAATSG
ncbi:DUF4365 domain-containing protein [Lentzea sp. NPDC058436]|uniref:DUF4365 domain-containing protein n=1 Tax=Lentzea sp. NPDC058436 TaxID=3346499 RepID=UPI003662CB15